jgi:hypothetical protein
MGSVIIEIGLELSELSAKVQLVPEEHLVEILATYRANQALDEWMREGNIKHCSHATRAGQLAYGDDEMDKEDDGGLHARTTWGIGPGFDRAKKPCKSASLRDPPGTGSK